jgi:hypothetical protein
VHLNYEECAYYEAVDSNGMVKNYWIIELAKAHFAVPNIVKINTRAIRKVTCLF